MDPKKDMEEKLREVACTGDEESVHLLVDKGVNVNAPHSMNGWTPIHWAAKRNHARIVSYLLLNGAEKTLKTNKGETALDLTDDSIIRSMLGGTGELNGHVSEKEDLPIVPNYISNPAFPYASQMRQRPTQTESPMNLSLANAEKKRPESFMLNGAVSNTVDAISDEELVLKARVAHSAESDFIEVELDLNKLTFEELITVMCHELGVIRKLVYKVRKLPDTIIRKDKDVKRLKNFQEIELVLTNKAISDRLSDNTRNYTPSVSPKQVDVVY